MTLKTSTHDTLVLTLAGDAYLGNPAFVILVDGDQVGGVQTLAALTSGQAQAFTITGDFGPGPHVISVRMLNPLAGATAATTRSLVLESVNLDGTVITPDTTVAETTNESITAAAPPAGSDTITVNVAEDAYDGNAEFLVLVDGVQVGGTQTATASHAAGAAQNITLTGDFGAGPHDVVVEFINDTEGPKPGEDRNLYVNAITYDGDVATLNQPLYSNGYTSAVAVSGAASVTAGSPAAGPVITSADTLTLYMAEDAYLGNAEFTLTVGGIAVGGTMSVTALHGLSAQESFTFSGDWGPNPQNVVVSFINDAYGGNTSEDRNLYVDGIVYDGVLQGGETAPLFSNGAAAFTVTDAPPPVVPASQPDTLILYMAEDAYLGNAEFTVLVDGKQVGGTMTVTALNTAMAEEAFTLTGDWGSGSQAVTVNFINDAYGGNASEDRNLYVKSIIYDGEMQADASASIFSNGPAAFTVQPSSQTTTQPTQPAQPALPDTLVLYVSEDYYDGNAEFSVTVDGKAVGGTQFATASHADGQVLPITLYGDFGTGAQTVTITFLNDAWGGSSALDRNLYVNAIDYNGVYTPVGAALLSNGNSTTNVVGASGTPATLLAPMAPPGKLEFVGVNLSGLEFGGPVYPGILGSNYIQPPQADVDYYAAEGMNIIRLPFDWERLQPTLDGPLNQSYLQLIENVVSDATAKGMTVDLDMHNYGEYYGKLIGSSAVPNSAFANAWSRIAQVFANTPKVMFGLMNEPSQQSAAQWLTSDNAAIAAIRAAGADQEVLVPGTDVSEGAWWISSGNANVMLGIVDPKMNFAYDIHQYNDSDDSGTSTAVVSPTIGVQNLTDVTQWAQATGSRLFLSEFGSGTDPASLAAMQNMLNYMAANNNVWQGATEWGGGTWWPSSYGFATDPVGGVTKPQISLLSSYTT